MSELLLRVQKALGLCKLLSMRGVNLKFYVGLLMASLSTSLSCAAAPSEGYLALRNLSYERSPEIQSARARKEAAAAARYSAFSNWLPRLNLELSQNRAKDATLFDSTSLSSLGPLAAAFQPKETTLKRAALVATLPLYKRSVDLNFRRASAESELAQKEYKIKSTEHDLRLRALFERYLFQSFKEHSLIRSLEITRSNQKEAALRFRIGQNTRLDVLRADASYAQYESQKLLFSQQKSSALQEFLQYSGLSLEDLKNHGVKIDFKDDDEVSKLIDDFTQVEELMAKTAEFQNLPELQSKVVQNNPSYQVYLAEETAAKRRAQLIFAEEWPELVASASLYKQSSEWSTTTESADRSYSLGILLRIPLFTGGGLLSRHRETVKNEEQARLKREISIRRLFDEIENQRPQITALASSVNSLKIVVAQNDEIVRLSQKSYQIGKTTFVELLMSQNELTQAKLTLVDSKIQLADLLRRFAWNLGVEEL